MNLNMKKTFLFALLAILTPFSLVQAQSTTVVPQGSSTESMQMAPSRLGVSFWGVLNGIQPTKSDLQRKTYSSGDLKSFSYSYFKINYKMNSIEKLSLGIPFIHLSLSNAESKFVALNLFLAYSNSSLFNWDSVLVSGAARVYLPTSQEAFDSKMLIGFRTELAAKMKIESWKWAYYFKPDFYVYAKNEYRDTSRGNQLYGSKMLKIEHYLEGEKALSRLFGFRPYVGFEDKWYNAASSKTKSNHETDMIVRMGLDINLSRSLSFGLGVENKTSLVNRATDWVPLASEDNGLFLVTYAEI